MRNIQTAILLAFLFVTASVSAQIRGKVIDDETGEALIGVAVIIDGTTKGASTDLDGNFQILAEPGTYNITASFISFAKTTISDVVVKEGEPTVLGTIRLKSAAEQLQAVEITAKQVKNTEAALVTMKRKSANVIDGISAASFKKVGDSDAASAMSRVTGVSVQGGKYVYVRGLGDRYTKTTLNGMDVPGLDPDRNTVQMDIFPTNIIDNITVSKSFTAELPADFTGGAVNIETKDFPEEKAMSFGVSLGYNPNMHFNSDYVTYDGGATDFLGFDDGTREIPTGGGEDIALFNDYLNDRNSPKGREFIETLNSFDKQMGGYRSTSFMNTGLSFSYADQLAPKGKYTLGYSFAMNYKNDVEFYEDAEFNTYGKPAASDDYELDALETRKGDYGVRNVLLGGMGGLAIKSEKSKYRVNFMHLQNGESKAGIFDYEANDVGTTFLAKQYNIDYSQRSLTNVLISGKHVVQDGKWELTWKTAPTRSAITDPDVRFLRYWINENTGEIRPNITSEVGFPERIWRFLTEYNIANKADGVMNYQFRGEDAKLKTGVSYTYKTRDFSIQDFQIFPGVGTDYQGNPDEIFADDNLVSEDNFNGVYHKPKFIPNNRNEYSSNVHHIGAYVSTEVQVSPLLKAIAGVRVEKYDQFYTGTNQTGSLELDNEKVLEDLDLFPTANLIYALTEKSNLRFSYSRTIARPSFKEMSYAEILDPISGRTFGGGLFPEVDGISGEVYWDGNLRSTKINNLDLRWELYHGIGQNVSVSAFYKMFDAPIEIVQYLSDPGLYQARNVGNATVLGTELELIQSMAFLGEKFNKFMFNTNITVTNSSIEMSASELRSRENSAKDGETIDNYRAMAGQAPYIINAGLSYNDRENGWTGNVSYNVQGRTLQFVGFGNSTDVYSVPFHNLSLKAGKTFGKDNRMSLSVKVSNILADEKEQVFEAYNAEDQIFQRLKPMRTFGVSFGWKL